MHARDAGVHNKVQVQLDERQAEASWEQLQMRIEDIERLSREAQGRWEDAQETLASREEGQRRILCKLDQPQNKMEEKTRANNFEKIRKQVEECAEWGTRARSDIGNGFLHNTEVEGKQAAQEKRIGDMEHSLKTVDMDNRLTRRR